MENKHLISQELRKYAMDVFDFKVSFFDSTDGVVVFDSERKPLYTIKNSEKQSIPELVSFLINKRNKLNRQIATLRKAIPNK